MSIRDFGRDEHETRLARLHSSMSDAHVDALFVADEKNLRYLTGYYTDQWFNKQRPAAGWFPLGGEPVLIVGALEEDWARQCSWCSVIRTYSDLRDEVVAGGAAQTGFEQAVAQAIVEAGRELQLTRESAIAIPRKSHMRLDLSVDVMWRVHAAFDAPAWLDASGLLWTLRSLKSPAEVAYIRTAVAALDSAYIAARDRLAVGVTEQEVSRVMRAGMLAGGADAYAYTSVGDLRNGVTSTSDRRYTPDALVLLDGGAVVRGYCADQSRLVSLGTPDKATRAGYSLVVEALEAGIDAVRPGATAGEVATRIFGVLGDAAGEHPTRASRVGHATGMEQPEPPSLQTTNRTQLEIGMVLSIEPFGFFDTVGLLIAEDMVVVTKNGAERLGTQPTPKQLLVA